MWICLEHYVTRGSVVIENKLPCKIAGIGSVRIKMFDGKIGTFGDVRHAPDLKRNIIFLSAHD